MSIYFNRFQVISSHTDGTVRFLLLHDQSTVFDGTSGMKLAKEMYLSLGKILEPYEQEHGKIIPDMALLKQLGVAPEDV